MVPRLILFQVSGIVAIERDLGYERVREPRAATSLSSPSDDAAAASNRVNPQKLISIIVAF